MVSNRTLALPAGLTLACGERLRHGDILPGREITDGSQCRRIEHPPVFSVVCGG